MKGINLRQGHDVTVSIPDNKATFEAQRKKFEKEAIRLYGLDNKHIVKVHDLFEENGTVYYFMDYIDGQSLAEIVNTKGPMSEKDALGIFRQILEALAVVHAQNDPMMSDELPSTSNQNKKMLHLDIKPANIMLDKAGNAWLIDFGSSKQIDDAGSLTTDSGFTLSKDYAPMELIGGVKDRIGPWTDLYELGGTLYYLLTGSKPPTSSELSMEGEQSFKFPSGISSSTCSLIRWMMALSPSNRPRSVTDVIQRIAGTGTTGGTETKKPEPESEKPEEPERPTTAPDDDETILKTSESVDDSTILNPSEPGSGEKPKITPAPSTATSASGGPSVKNIWIAIALIFGTVGIVYGGMYLIDSRGKSVGSKTDKDAIIKNLINNMVYVSGGTFTMGATSEQGSDAFDDEKPAHQVTVSSYSIGKYEVTQEEWEAVMGNNPSYFKGAKRPVENVSWNDCQDFIRKLNAMTGKKFRLPTEAEWEYAARGGNNSRKYKYAGSSTIGSVAWYDVNSNSKTHNVGSKAANELGLYDMSGNVWEWCQDWSGSYSSGSQTNPTGPSSGSLRVYRGGSWGSYEGDCRVSGRYGRSPGFRNYGIGLRLAL